MVMGPHRKSKLYIKESSIGKSVVKDNIPVTSVDVNNSHLSVRKHRTDPDNVNSKKQQICLPLPPQLSSKNDCDCDTNCLKSSAVEEKLGPKRNVDPSSKKLDLQMAEKRDDSICEGDDLLNTQLSSQDNYPLDSSQDDTQCDVRWDCSSPETMTQLKKKRGKYSVQDVMGIIANFPDLPTKPVSKSFHRIQFSPPNVVETVSEKNRILKAKQRLQLQERCKGAVEDMLLFLQQQQKQKLAADNERPVEVSTDKDTTVDERLSEVNGHEDSWSDDDLFRDNSFLIEATQNVEDILSLIGIQSNDLDSAASSSVATNVISDASGDMFLSMLSSKSLSVSSMANSTSVIPSSYVGNAAKEKRVPSTKTLCDKNSNIKTKYPVSNPNLKIGHTTMTTNGKLNVPSTKSITNAHKQNSLISRDVGKNHIKGNTAGVDVGKLTTATEQNGAMNATQRSLRRHQTFENNRNPHKPHIKKSNSSLNSPFRRCLSFDDSHSSHSKSSCSASGAELSFDSSLTDELLLQATEDVDSLVNQKTSNNAIGNSLFLDNCAPKPCTFLPKPQYSSNSCNLYNSCNSNKDISTTLLSPVRPLNRNLNDLRKVQSNAVNSPVQSFFKKSFGIDSHQAIKHKSEEGPSSSTPVKVAKSLDKMETLSTKGSDSFMEDDSFMNDDAMFESQILPILEMAETQVTTKKSMEPSSPVKYSLDEIEKKRKAALEKLMKNNPVVKDKPNTDLSPGDVKQSQTVSSPRKCSQDEIDRKKQAAQCKLLARTNSTGSINFSQINIAPSKPSTNGDTSPHKCSQEEIKLKREEALRKRRLRLQQAPNRKS